MTGWNDGDGVEREARVRPLDDAQHEADVARVVPVALEADLVRVPRGADRHAVPVYAGHVREEARDVRRLSADLFATCGLWQSAQVTERIPERAAVGVPPLVDAAAPAGGRCAEAFFWIWAPMSGAVAPDAAPPVTGEVATAACGGPVGDDE